MHLDELVQAGEDGLELLLGEVAPVCHGLIEEFVEHTEHAHMGRLRHQELCGDSRQEAVGVGEHADSGGVGGTSQRQGGEGMAQG